MDQPFTLEDAKARGLEYWHLRSRRKWQRVAHGIYASAERASSPLTQLAAASLRLPPSAVFSGRTAAWLHGLDTPFAPIEMTIAPGIGISARAGMKVRRCRLEERDFVSVRNLTATSVERTLGDLSARLTLTEAVVIADTALRLRRTNLKQLLAAAAAATGRVGVTRFRRVIEHADPKAGSQMETRLRILLVL